MYQVVIDTNVLVAGLLSNLGASHRVLRLVGDRRWRINLSVLELAVESRADFLITFNTRDFVGAERFGVRVISPREFLAIIGEAL